MEEISFLSMRSYYFHIGIRLIKQISDGIRVAVKCTHPNIPDPDKLYMLEITEPSSSVELINYKPYDIYKRIGNHEYLLPFIGTIMYKKYVFI